MSQIHPLINNFSIDNVIDFFRNKIHSFNTEDSDVFYLIKDIRYYFTMPTYTLRRLAVVDLKPKSPKADWDEFYKELNTIRKYYGDNYLQEILDRFKDQNEEIIIAIENR